MTLIFNSEKYQKSLCLYQPKLIKAEEENEKALTIVEELMNKSKRTLEEDELYQLLIVLIEKFEQKFYGDRTSNSHSMLFFLNAMKLLLDTHIWLWYLLGNERLSVDLQNIIA